MKQKIYLRLAKKSGGGHKVDAGLKSNPNCIFTTGSLYNKKALPTVRFAVEVNVPDEMFSNQEQVVAKINLELKEDRIVAKSAESL